MIVDVGDRSIEEIAAKYRIPAAKILADNRLESVRKGQRLWVSGQVTVVVGPTDTVESIAAEWGIPPEAITGVNKTPLAVGQRLHFEI